VTAEKVNCPVCRIKWIVGRLWETREKLAPVLFIFLIEMKRQLCAFKRPFTRKPKALIETRYSYRSVVTKSSGFPGHYSLLHLDLYFDCAGLTTFELARIIAQQCALDLAWPFLFLGLLLFATRKSAIKLFEKLRAATTLLDFTGLLVDSQNYTFVRLTVLHYIAKRYSVLSNSVLN
jgi:hypothetical protein